MSRRFGTGHIEELWRIGMGGNFRPAGFDNGAGRLLTHEFGTCDIPAFCSWAAGACFGAFS